MNVVIWARVSSREQREGYSIDAQLRANRDRAEANGWTVVKEFVVAESAKRGVVRQVFNEMYAWVKANAKREKIKAILSHKLDRACRNMRDAVRLQELEDTCGVQLAFVENHFGPGAAGALSFNVMAAVAQYYSDNLRSEVLKGMDEKVRQGWPTGHAPYGYVNVDDKNEPVQPHPENGPTVARIFERYATGAYTFQLLADLLLAEGHLFKKSQPRFNRTALSYILANRFYIGELHRNGQVFEGRYKRLVDRATFDTCQDVLAGKNRRTGKPELPLSGGLFTCAYCGQSITGERIRRKLRGGSVNEHVYYRCANNHPGPDHPAVRWKADKLEQAIVDDLASMRMPSPEIAAWFRTALQVAVTDLTANKRRQVTALAKRKSELATMQDRLLNAYLGGTIDEATFRTKSAELKSEAAKADEVLDKVGNGHAARGDSAVAVFDWAQHAAETWRGSNIALKREILDSVCLNRILSDVSLVTIKRKPFDVFAEGLNSTDSRGDWTTIELFLGGFDGWSGYVSKLLQL
jgi:site-specific DNA recombinase